MTKPNDEKLRFTSITKDNDTPQWHRKVTHTRVRREKPISASKYVTLRILDGKSSSHVDQQHKYDPATKTETIRIHTYGHGFVMGHPILKVDWETEIRIEVKPKGGEVSVHGTGKKVA